MVYSLVIVPLPKPRPAFSWALGSEGTDLFSIATLRMISVAFRPAHARIFTCFVFRNWAYACVGSAASLSKVKHARKPRRGKFAPKDKFRGRRFVRSREAHRD
jgi:hypothetical protein